MISDYMKNSQKCFHPSFAIIKKYDKEVKDDMLSLVCYECGEEMPFEIYDIKEWKQILKATHRKK